MHFSVIPAHAVDHSFGQHDIWSHWHTAAAPHVMTLLSALPSTSCLMSSLTGRRPSTRLLGPAPPAVGPHASSRLISAHSPTPFLTRRAMSLICSLWKPRTQSCSAMLGRRTTWNIRRLTLWTCSPGACSAVSLVRRGSCLGRCCALRRFTLYLDAMQGDIITLDILTDISDAREWTAVELVWLVDSPTEEILKSCVFEWSSDSTTWVSSPPRCIQMPAVADVY